MQQIHGLTDPQLAAYEDRAEAAMRAALQQVMDKIADRIASVQTASGRSAWFGCRFCLNPRHPGPCAKPGSKAYERRHGKGKAAPAGGGADGEVVSGREALKQTPAVAPHTFSRDEMPPDTIELRPAEKEALDVYSNDAQRINDQLRSGKPSARTERTARQIDHVMDRSPLRSDIEVHRGITDGETVFGSRLHGNLVGAEWSETAFVSTTANRYVATQFAGMHGNRNRPVVMRVTAPKGTGAVTMSGWGDGTALGGQAEVLLPRGLRFQVTNDHGVNPVVGIDGGARLLDVEVLAASVQTASGREWWSGCPHGFHSAHDGPCP